MFQQILIQYEVNSALKIVTVVIQRCICIPTLCIQEQLKTHFQTESWK